MRQVGIATINYANDNNGALPERYDGDRGTPYNDYDMTFETWDTSVTIPGDTIAHPTYALGLLYSQGYVRNDKVFYCPSQRDNGFNYDSYPHPFFSAPGQAYDVSYMFNPHHTDLSPTSPPPTDVLYHKLAQMHGTVPSNSNPTASGVTNFAGCRPALALEMIKSMQWTGHTDPSHPGTPAFNLLYPDGHVTSVYSKGTYQLLLGYWQKNGGGLGGSGGWQRFDQVLKQLETDSQSQGTGS
jgi:prepilin-type processing-associated H-X9-DG protein